MTAIETSSPDPTQATRPSRPLYPRLLRLRHIAPNAWQRAVLGEGALAAAVLLVLADLASAWTLLVLPLAVAGVVKAHDVLAGLLHTQPVIGDKPMVEDPDAWYEDGPYEDSSYEDGPYEDGPYEDGPYEDGPYEDAYDEGAPYDQV